MSIPVKRQSYSLLDTHRWEAEGVVRGHCDDSAILNAGSTADRDFIHVAADHGAIPINWNQNEHHNDDEEDEELRGRKWKKCPRHDV